MALGTIQSMIEVSHSSTVILILDCCYSGAGGDEFNKGGLDEQLQMTSKARGTYIMTASTSLQVATENESDQYGVFTKHIIEGIRDGKADRNNDHEITMDELYSYVHDEVMKESVHEPMRWNIGVQGDLPIAHSGEARREDRGRQIRAKIVELDEKRLLPNSIVSKALEIIASNSLQLSELNLTYESLLELLMQEEFNLGEFIEQWYQATTSQPSNVEFLSDANQIRIEATELLKNTVKSFYY